MIFGGASGMRLGGLAGALSRIRRFVGPGTLPFTSVYVPLTGPYRRNPPAGVMSVPSVPILRTRLLYSMRWW